MKKIFTNKPLLSGLMATAFCFATASANATTTTLLDENFDFGLPVAAQTLGGGSVNLRSGTDAINTYNAGNPLQRFALSSGTNFFLPATAANKFLVMGDDSGQLAGSPTAGTFGFATPFTLAAGTTDINVSFDWVFSAFGSGGDTDQFKVGIGGNGFNINSPMTTNTSIVNQSITNFGKAYGPASINILASSLGAPDANGQYWLSFGYFENASSATNGAVGIDNIKITANVAPVPVPVPGAVWLLGSGLAGLVGLQRRKQMA